MQKHHFLATSATHISAAARSVRELAVKRVLGESGDSSICCSPGNPSDALSSIGTGVFGVLRSLLCALVVE